MESELKNLNDEILRGEIYYADLSPVFGSEQGGMRPVLVVQNNIGNKFSPTIIVCAITSQLTKARLPTHIEIAEGQFGLPKDSVVLLEQIRTVDKRRLKDKVGCLDQIYLNKVDKALIVSLGL
jgi:mRNA interferase MazF